MTEHLPECPWIEPIDHGDGSFTEAPCICPALRACRERTLTEVRDAVAAMSATAYDPAGLILSIDRNDTLAAIDALRGESDG